MVTSRRNGITIQENNICVQNLQKERILIKYSNIFAKFKLNLRCSSISYFPPFHYTCLASVEPYLNLRCYRIHALPSYHQPFADYIHIHVHTILVAVGHDMGIQSCLIYIYMEVENLWNINKGHSINFEHPKMTYTCLEKGDENVKFLVIFSAKCNIHVAPNLCFNHLGLHLHTPIQMVLLPSKQKHQKKLTTFTTKATNHWKPSPTWLAASPFTGNLSSTPWPSHAASLWQRTSSCCLVC